MSNKIERTSKGLAEAMFDELDALREGTSTPQMARAKASIASTICAISRLEMDFARFVSEVRRDKSNIGELPALPMARIG